MKNRNYCT